MIKQKTLAKFPCKDCGNRKIGCHDTCKEYQDAKKKQEELRELAEKQRKEMGGWW